MLNEKGHEVLDSTPLARTVGFRPPPTLAETIKRLVHGELSRRAAEVGDETFEEADDFEIGDDYDPRSPWELAADQEVYRPDPAPPQSASPTPTPPQTQADKPANPAPSGDQKP